MEQGPHSYVFFTLAPELDSQIQNTGGARAISYQIIRCGLTSSSTSRPRYQLFRSDVTDVETFQAGYNLHPNSTVYSNGNNGIRKPSNITNPVFETPNGPSMDFSLAANIIDFGIRAYILEENSLGTSNLLQIFRMLMPQQVVAILHTNSCPPVIPTILLQANHQNFSHSHM